MAKSSTTPAIDVTALDVDDIKASLIDYLKTTDKFKDYNFEGSNLSLLLNVLAYNTHYMAVYANALANEMFLDSAVKRSSVVSRAKELGYIPRSMVAPVATLNVTFDPPGDPVPAIIARDTRFTTTLNGKTYIFTTTATINVFPDNTGAYSKDIDIYQGRFVTYRYTVSEATEEDHYVIPNANVDKRFLRVTVKFNATATTEEEYVLSESLIDVNDDSLVYYLDENEEGLLELRFGDNVLGKALEPGNVITIEYFITDGPEANGARTFARVDSIAGSNTVTVTTISAASGGAASEDIDSIKFIAPRFYQAQDRTATELDYSAIILRDYPNIDSVSVWGGEENEPPFYGKVFIAINPKENVVLSTTAKQSIIEDILRKYNIMAIRPEIVDPQFLWVVITVHVAYDSTRTRLSLAHIEDSIRQTIIDYFDNELNSFNAILRYSNLGTAIDESEPFIKSSIIGIKFLIRVTPNFGTVTQYTLNFSNAVNPSSLTSSGFVYSGNTYTLRDVPSGTAPHSTGIIQSFRTVGNSVVILNPNQGTIDYETGKVVINSLRIDDLSDQTVDYLTVTTSPAVAASTDIPYTDFNIYTNSREQLLALDEASLEINLIPEIA